jgi:predicted AAA+ superfamily ATPase
MDISALKPLVRQKILDFSLAAFTPIFPRDLDLGKPRTPQAGNLVTVVVGMRRSGKTYRLFQEIETLLKEGLSPRSILYFNFEDDRLRPLTSAVGDLVIETFYELNPQAKTEGAYFFLDEVQEIPDWGIWLRRVIDTEKASVYVSGSSAHILAADVATEFRGRSLTSELLPYGFSEYLRYHNNGIPTPPFSTADTLQLKKMFEQYLVQGGFPAVQNEKPELAISILQGYAKLVVARDVIERHNLNNPLAVSLFSQQALAYNGRELSLRKTEARLRTQGVPVSRATLGEALAYFEDAFLLAQVRLYSRALSEDSNMPPKVYAIDPGLAYANSLASSEDIGQRFEDAIYLELRRRNPHRRDKLISTFKTKTGGYGVDFIADDALEPAKVQLVQVCADIEDAKTRSREIRALRAAMEQITVPKGTIVTLGTTAEELDFEEGHITIIPAWTWLLSGW